MAASLRSRALNDAKYIGLDVHQATITVAVRDSAGKLMIEAILFAAPRNTETNTENLCKCTVLSVLQAHIWYVSRSATPCRTSFEHLAPPIIPVLALIVLEKETCADLIVLEKIEWRA